MIKPFKTIFLPHLQFSVDLYDLSVLKTEYGMEEKGFAFTSVDGQKPHTAQIFVKDIKNSVRDIYLIPTIVHELTHVIQIICEMYIMDIENEKEHMAYIMSYMLSEIMDFDYIHLDISKMGKK